MIDKTLGVVEKDSEAREWSFRVQRQEAKASARTSFMPSEVIGCERWSSAFGVINARFDLFPP